MSKICEGKTVFLPLHQDMWGLQGGYLTAVCDQVNDEDRFCGFKVQPERFGEKIPTGGSWSLSSDEIEPLLREHTKKRADAKFERGI